MIIIIIIIIIIIVDSSSSSTTTTTTTTTTSNITISISIMIIALSLEIISLASAYRQLRVLDPRAAEDPEDARVDLSVVPEMENGIYETGCWLKRQSGKQEMEKDKHNAKTVKRRNGKTGNGKRSKRTGQPS